MAKQASLSTNFYGCYFFLTGYVSILADFSGIHKLFSTSHMANLYQSIVTYIEFHVVD